METTTKENWGSNTYHRKNIKILQKGCNKTQRRTLNTAEMINPIRRYNPTKHVYSQHRSTEIY